MTAACPDALRENSQSQIISARVAYLLPFAVRPQSHDAQACSSSASQQTHGRPNQTTHRTPRSQPAATSAILTIVDSRQHERRRSGRVHPINRHHVARRPRPLNKIHIPPIFSLRFTHMEPHTYEINTNPLHRTLTFCFVQYAPGY